MTASPEHTANERADFRDALENGRRALFADSGEECRDALVRLIGDAELRRGLVEESGKLIEQVYQIVRSAKPLAHAMGLAENGIARRYGAHFEILALRADATPGRSAPYFVSALRQDGVTVLRCATPGRDWAEPPDPKIEGLAVHIVRDFAIDRAGRRRGLVLPYASASSAACPPRRVCVFSRKSYGRSGSRTWSSSSSTTASTTATSATPHGAAAASPTSARRRNRVWPRSTLVSTSWRPAPRSGRRAAASWPVRRAYGVAVTAGNRGDVGRGIEPGRDGWVIDVFDDADSRHLLRHLNANPDNGRLEPRLPDTQR